MIQDYCHFFHDHYPQLTGRLTGLDEHKCLTVNATELTQRGTLMVEVTAIFYALRKGPTYEQEGNIVT